jgi:hypothetical protein
MPNNKSLKKGGTMSIPNLCATCLVSFPECSANPIFACDVYPEGSLGAREKDAVVECDGYVEDPVLVDYYAQ